MVVMGTNLNATLRGAMPTDPDANIGAASELLGHMPSRNERMHMLLVSTRGLQMTWRNSYKRWWRTALADHDQLPKSSGAAIGDDEDGGNVSVYEWEGHIFGHRTRRLLDYIDCDIHSVQRAVRGHVLRHLGFVTDHTAVGETYNLTATGMAASANKMRAAPNPNGWQARTRCRTGTRARRGFRA